MIIDILRKPKLFDIALFDVFSVLIILYFIANIISKYYKINRNKLDGILLLIILIIGLITHKIFNIDTKLGYYLNINKNPR